MVTTAASGAIRVGINGFGRIGRTVFRASMAPEYKNAIEIVHVNDLTEPEMIAHLLKYDSVHGRFNADVKLVDNYIQVNDKRFSVSAQRNPADIPWKEKGVDIVFECTGIYRDRAGAQLHMAAGCKKVLISAPASGEDITVVYGVNSHLINAEHKILSNGSCTTNCLAPVTKVIHERFTVVSALMNTVHSYTNDQRILDMPHSDMRRARAGAVNMIPTSTGAAKAIGLVLPDLKGKIDGLSVRVPTPNVSLVDVTFVVKKPCTVQEVNDALRSAANSQLKGILGYTDEELVSSDFNGDTRSSIVDGSMTKVVDGTLVKILSWYDNETGFSNRMLDVAKLMRI